MIHESQYHKNVGASDHTYEHTSLHFIPICRIDEVSFEKKCYGNQQDDSECIRIHRKLVAEKVLQCKCPDDDDGAEIVRCINDQCLYTIHITGKYGRSRYIVHPCEKEHMERYLAGTDDPMYDFVHELRYNPDSAFGRERQEAESHFKKHKAE